ncbi:MAG: recombinase family protein [Mycobacterium sp.]|uniref:recombinase family protein n=1 Tax=Mycobacterium sp. TaxID=1785 RepID=UPI003F971927
MAHTQRRQWSTGQQSIDQQHDAIAAAGITPDRVFTDTASGRAGSNRPGWTECMGWLREGDHLVVVAVDRLGRSVREVASALHELTTRGVHVRSLREGGVDTSTPRQGVLSPASWPPSPSWNWNWARSAVRHLVRLGWHADWPPPNR